MEFLTSPLRNNALDPLIPEAHHGVKNNLTGHSRTRGNVHADPPQLTTCQFSGEYLADPLPEPDIHQRPSEQDET